MKKANRKNNTDDLVIDFVECTLTGWLVRQNVFEAFKANLDSTNLSRGSFRDQLRLHIRVALTTPGLGLSGLIDSAFPFLRTPEGVDFWEKQSDAWERFCIKLGI